MTKAERLPILIKRIHLAARVNQESFRGARIQTRRGEGGPIFQAALAPGGAPQKAPTGTRCGCARASGDGTRGGPRRSVSSLPFPNPAIFVCQNWALRRVAAFIAAACGLRLAGTSPRGPARQSVIQRRSPGAVFVATFGHVCRPAWLPCPAQQRRPGESYHRPTAAA